MTNAIFFSWVNILAVSVAVGVITTWGAAAAKIFRTQNRIIVVSTGVVILATGVALARIASLMFRTFGYPVGEEFVLVGVVGECLGLSLIMVAVFIPVPPRVETVASYRGVWCGLLAFAVLAFLWVFYRR